MFDIDVGRLLLMSGFIKTGTQVKTIPVQAWNSSWGFQEVERFQDIRHMNLVNLSALCTVRLYPSENIRGTNFCSRLNQLQGP